MPNIFDEALDRAIPMGAADPLPWHLDMMQHLPTYTTSAGALGIRGGRTILGGGWRERRGREAGLRRNLTIRGYLWEGAKHHNPLLPRTWGRFADQSVFHLTGPATHTVAGGTGGLKRAIYSPFYMSHFMNWMGRRGGGLEGGKNAGRFVRGGLGLIRSGMRSPDHWVYSEGGELMSRGFYSRINAAGRIGWMSDTRFAARYGGAGGQHLARFLTASGVADAGAVIRSGRGATQAALLMGGKGTISGYLGGFISNAGGTLTPKQISRLAGGKGAARGAKAGARWAAAAAQGGTWAARGKAAALLGAQVGLLAAPVVGWAALGWLAFDLARLGTKGMGHIARGFAGAARSFEGGMRTGIMQQEFRDNEVTRTSRARGVAAISNSRLNARSVLGTEAAAMAQHFGV